MTPIVDSTESIPVQLTRMEGVLNLVNSKVDDVRNRVEKHEGEISVLKAGVQSLQEGTVASDKATVALALALKEAKETADAASTSGYSPITKLYAAAAFVGGAILVYQNVTGR